MQRRRAIPFFYAREILDRASAEGPCFYIFPRGAYASSVRGDEGEGISLNSHLHGLPGALAIRVDSRV